MWLAVIEDADRNASGAGIEVGQAVIDDADDENISKLVGRVVDIENSSIVADTGSKVLITIHEDTDATCKRLICTVPSVQSIIGLV